MPHHHLVVGTAGHIDHGKSSLVLALTGIDPDRLKEEKRRGITIELGFADLDLGDGRILSFVDVPGHERFVRHMVAGATGIDAVLLVVAADQGVQPQTREHLDICSLLGVRRGIVALSKCDLAEPELREVVALELRELLAGTFLAGALLVEVSARDGRGVAELRAALGALVDEIPPRPMCGIPRLAVDRSFVMRGFGTVVTGTLASGRLAEGAEVEVLPGGRHARIRGLQVHRHRVGEAVAGQRTAVNLQGLGCDEVPRGTSLCPPGAFLTTRRAWARVELLASAPASLARGGNVRFHHGTSDQAARMRVLGRTSDGASAVEMRFAEEAALAPGDRFILRRPGPVDTVGGGVIVDVRPPRAGRNLDAAAFDLRGLAPERALQLRLERAGERGRDRVELQRELGLASSELDLAFAALAGAGAAVQAATSWFDRVAWERIEQRALAELDRHHAEQPLRTGLSREALRASCCREMPQESWRELLERLAARGELRLDGEELARRSHRVVLPPAAVERARSIEERFRRAGLEPPDLAEVVPEAERAAAEPIIQWLVAQGKLVRIQDRRLFHGEALAGLRTRLREYARTSRTIDVGAFKQLAGVTRKNAIPLLEQLDAERATRRVGELREILLAPEG